MAPGVQRQKTLRKYYQDHYQGLVPGRVTAKWLTKNGFKDQQEMWSMLDIIERVDRRRKRLNKTLTTLIYKAPNTPLKNVLREEADASTEVYENRSGKRAKVIHKVTTSIFDKIRNKKWGVQVRYWIVDPKSQIWYSYWFGAQSSAWMHLQPGEYLILNEEVYDSDVTDHEQWADLKRELKALGDRLTNKEKDDRVMKDQRTLGKVLWDLSVDEEDADINGLNDVMHLGSRMILMQLVKVTDPDISQVDTFPTTRVRDCVSERYIPNKFLTYKIDKDAASWDYLILDDKEAWNLRQSCVPKMIFKTYKNSVERYTKDQVTIESIYKICKGEEYPGGEVEMTIEETIKWFKHYSVGIEFFDIENRLIHSYHPPSYHWAIRPRVMRVIYSNEHLETIKELKSFELRTTEETEELSARIRVPVVKDIDQGYLCNTPGECFAAIKNAMSGPKVKCVNIVYNDKLNDVVHELLSRGLNPKVITKSSITITGLRLDNLVLDEESISVNIKTAIDVKAHEEFKLESINQWMTFKKEEALFQSILMHKQHLSEMSDEVSQVFDKYDTTIAVGKVVPDNVSTLPLDRISVVDFKKFYASCLKDLPYIPVICPFDKFYEAAPGHKVRDDELYILEILEATPLYNKKHTLAYGFEVTRMKGVKYIIHAYMRLICLPINAVREGLLRLYTEVINELAEFLVKSIPNKAIGMCGKKYNRKRTTHCFRKEEDADLYLRTHKRGMKFELEKGVWIVNSIQERRLENGFRPIREAILGMARLKLLQMSQALNDAGYRILGYKTDAIYVEANTQQVSRMSCINSSTLGGVTVEGSKLPPNYPLMYSINDAFKYERRKPILEYFRGAKTMSDDNEFDTSYVSSKIVNRTALFGRGGCAKTFSGLTYLKSKYGIDDILVVCPWNSQAKNVKSSYGVESITLHRLLGDNIDDKTMKTPYNVSKVNAIQFDEIMLLTLRQLVKLNKFMMAHPDIEYLATGDPCQLKAIGDIIDNERKKEYISQMFPNIINLTVNKRIKREDLQRLRSIEHDMFSGSMTIAEVVYNHFSDRMISSLDEMRDAKIYRAVSYLDSSSKTVNTHIHSYYPHSKHMKDQVKTLQNGITYRYHGELICKVSMKLGKLKLHPNYIYKIMGMNKKDFLLKDVLDGSEFKVSHDTIVKHFSLPYCNTVHAAQGDKIAEKFVIFDWNVNKLVDMHWLNTAITRCTRLDDVYFYKGSLKDINMDTVAQHMVVGYRLQDKKAGRDIDDDLFVTPSWIVDQYMENRMCKKCGASMSFEKNSKHKVTVNRVNNGLAHHISNCELMCLQCNRTLK